MSEEPKKVQVHKVTLMVVDHDGLGADGLRVVLEETQYPNHCAWPQVARVETVNVDWVDDNPLNYEAKWRAEFERLFSAGITCAKCGGYTMAAIDEALQARCTCE